MGKYEPIGPGGEVLGQVMLSMMENMNAERIRPHLERHGLGNLDPEAWYPIETWLDVFNDMETESGAYADFVSAGMAIADKAVFPPEFDNMSFIEIMQTWNDAYLMNNRGEGMGEMPCEVINDKHIAMIARTPYPDDYIYGSYYGAARHFLPDGTDFTVYFDEEEPRREEGGERTIVHIEWE